MDIELQIERQTFNNLSDDNIRKQLKQIAESHKGKSLSPGITGTVLKHNSERIDDKTFYTARIKLEKTGNYRSEEAAARHLEEARKYVTKSAQYRQWTIKGTEQELEDREAVKENRSPLKIDYDLTDAVIAKEFPDIFERNPHFKLIHSVIKTAVESNFEERNNILLYGLPGTAKTTIFMKLKEFYEKGSDSPHFTLIDSTTLTKSGLERWLIEQSQSGALTEFLVFEEIEKIISAHPDSLSCLLSLMDSRGTISRLNARQGKIDVKVKCLVFATSNSPTAIQKAFDGAIWSRFGAYRLPCTRPSKAIAREILLRKIRERRERGQKGEAAWADKIIEYFFVQKEDNDLRSCIGALAGGEKIMTGEFFANLDKIMSDFDKDDKMQVALNAL